MTTRYRLPEGASEAVSPNLKKVLRSLQCNKKIILKPSYKGGNIVIMHDTQYCQMRLKILQNREWHELSTLDASQESHAGLTGKISRANIACTIDSSTRDFLINKFPRTLVFYVLPKIQKKTSPPPDRPIVSG